MTPRRALSLGLAALAFALPLSIAGTNAALAIISAGLLWLLSSSEGRPAAIAALRDAARSPVFLSLAAYAAWGIVASVAGLDPAASLRLLPKDAHKLWAFLVIASALAVADEAAITAPFASGLAIHSIVGAAQAAQQWLAGAERVRAHGFMHPVSYSEILGLGLIGLAAHLARRSGPPARRPLSAGLLALTAASLVLSQTRAVLIALSAAFATACALEPRWRRHTLKALLILLCVGAFWEVMPTGGRNLRTLLGDGGGTTAHRARFVLWDVALRIVRDHPLTGVGPGRFRAAFETYHPENLDGEGSSGNAHNVYLHQLAERGVVGLLALLAVLGIFWAGAWRADRKRRDAWSLWAATATAAFLVMNLTEVAWQTEQVATMFLFVWLLGTSPRPMREIL